MAVLPLGRPNKVAVITRVFFYKKMYGRFAPREAKNSGRDNEVTVLPRLLKTWP